MFGNHFEAYKVALRSFCYCDKYLYKKSSLKCGHSFCRDCLQSWFFSKFEDACAHRKINLSASEYRYLYAPPPVANEAERDMMAFAALSNRIRPDYTCPSCRDPLLPSVRNSYLDFKLMASLTTLNALIGYVAPEAPEVPGWKLGSIDMLSFLNSRFYSRNSRSRYSANFLDEDYIDVDYEESEDEDVDMETLAY